MAKQQKQVSPLGCLSLIALAGLIMFGYFANNPTGSGPGTPSSSNGDYSVYAYAMSKDFVRDRLCSPSTASFPWSATRVDAMGQGHYKVVAYVDSENAFGGTVRTNYICELKI